MGMLDSVLGGLLGGNSNAGPLQSILGGLLGGGGGMGGMLGGMLGGGHQQPQQQGGMGGLGDLLGRFTQAGYGQQANSWVGHGANQPIEPHQLEEVFGQQQVDQWSQQTGMGRGDLLSQLSNLLPHAVDKMTPNGQLPSSSPFDEGGVELPRR